MTKSEKIAYKIRLLWKDPAYKERMSRAHIGQISWNKGKKTGLIPWNKGLKGIHLSPSTEFKTGRRDEIHPEWKGEEASYHAKHAWVARWKGKPKLCEHCGTTEAKVYNWANVSRLYKRDLDDWIRLCRKCHHKFDGISSKVWQIRKSV